MNHWILDRRLLSGELEEGRAHLKALDHIGATASVVSLEDFYIGRVAVPPEGAFIQGTIPFVRNAIRENKASDGPFQLKAFFDQSLHDVLSYRPVYEGVWLNQEQHELPLAGRKGEIETLIERFGGSVFIRPASGLKLFDPWVVNRFNLDSFIDHLAVKDVYQATCLASPPRSIREEYRIIIVDGFPVTGSRYIDHGAIARDPESTVPVAAFTLASKIEDASVLADRAFVCDVARLADDEFRVVELNAFSTSGMYGCDLKKAFGAVHEAINNERM